MRAIEASKRDGRVRHIGITGHKDPSVLLRALEDFPFDSVLCTLGIDDRFVGASFAGDALPQFLDKGISIVAMKVFAEGKAVVEGIDLEKCLHYTLSLPISTAIIGMASPAQVEQNVAWVRSFAGMTEDETNALAADVSRLIDTGAIWWKR
jgi:hypothetical protein